MNLDSYKKSADFFYQTGTLEKTPKIEVGEWADTRFVEGFSKRSAPTRISIRPVGCCAKLTGVKKGFMRIYPKRVTPECFNRGSTMLTTTLSHVEWVGVQSELRLDSRPSRPSGP
jgi:hypothetical protein